MNFLRSLISFVNDDNTLPIFLQEPLASCADPMPFKFYEQVIGDHSDKERRLRSFASLISNFKTTTTPVAAVKTLTVIFKTITEVKYDEEFLEELCNMEVPDFKGSEEMKVSWIKDISVCCKSYLLRLPSLAPLFKRAGDKAERANIPA